MRLIQKENMKITGPMNCLEPIDKISYREFDSIAELYEYINKTPLNEIFRWRKLSSSEVGYKSTRFTKTKSFEDAVDKLLHGDEETAKTLTERAKVECKMENLTTRKTVYDVQGFQASVPRYLQGIPTSMVNQKMVPAKQKVITITKNIGYTCSFSAEDIIKESINAMKLVKQIEARGMRCNLYVTSIAADSSVAIGYRVKVKNANEKLNISKLAFTMANPSMLRRIAFRYREVAPETTSGFADGYGHSLNPKELFQVAKGEYFLPTMTGEFDEVAYMKEAGII